VFYSFTKLDLSSLTPFTIVSQTPNPRAKHDQPDGYVDLYNLVTHRRSRSVEDVLHRAHVAAFYLFCLKNKTKYFADRPPDANGDDCGLTDDESFIGSLLLHHLMVLQFNSFEVSELRQGNKRQQQTIFIGGSVYPTLALLNHSCNPCVVRYTQRAYQLTNNMDRILRLGTTGEPQS